MKRTGTAGSVLLVAFLCVGILIAQAPKTTANDPSIGTWVLNAQRSKFPGPPPQTFIERYDMRPDGFFVSTRSIVANDGSPGFQQAVFKIDGKDYELWDNSSLAEFLASGKRTPQTLSGKAIDAYTVEYAVKQMGKVITTGHRTISKDGKTMTFSSKILNAQGQWVEVEVYRVSGRPVRRMEQGFENPQAGFSVPIL